MSENKNILEKGDTILTRKGREMKVIAIHIVDKKIVRVDAIDMSEPSPLRTPVQAIDIVRILRKAKPRADKIDGKGNKLDEDGVKIGPTDKK